MIQAGKYITRADEPMVKLPVEHLYRSIRSPRPEVESAIRQLRQLLSIDAKKYAIAKRQLPYFVCGIFNPAYRKGDHFAWIQHFMLDIDHLAEKGLEAESLKQRLSHDSRVEMAFDSPGGDGLKLMFRLTEKCFDKGQFSLFYKAFSLAFAGEYQLNQVLDGVTSDVTRACFISVDPLVHYNPQCTPVAMGAFVDFNSSSQVRELQGVFRQTEAEQSLEPPREKGPDEAALLLIKQRLNPNFKPRLEKSYYVPQEVEQAVEAITARMQQEGIEVALLRSISYGKKLVFKLGFQEGEVNLFYGRKGFSVVQSMRNGTSKQMNEVCVAIISEVLFGGFGLLAESRDDG